MYRQGDVLLVPVAALPASPAVPRDRGLVVLAYGEVTGHAHFVRELDAVLLAANEAMRQTASQAGVTDTRAVLGGLHIGGSGATLYHGTPTLASAGPRDSDHDAILLPAGDYIVIQPREYDDTTEFRRVVD